MEVIIYTLQNCGNCMMLKRLLERVNIKFIEETNVDSIVAMGIKNFPQLSVNGELMDFTKSCQWIKQQNNT